MGWWKPYEDLTDWQKAEARSMGIEDFQDWEYHFDGIILVAAAKPLDDKEII